MALAYWATEFSLIRVLESEEWSHVEAPEGVDRPLDVIVLHTSDSSTRKALKAASSLAVELSARVHILALRVVPYPLELNAPQVPVSFTANQLRKLAEQAGVEAAIDIVLCRDMMTTLSTVLSPQSLIVLGESHTPWWRLGWLERENRLAQRLRTLGHQVVSADLL